VEASYSPHSSWGGGLLTGLLRKLRGVQLLTAPPLVDLQQQQQQQLKHTCTVLQAHRLVVFACTSVSTATMYGLRTQATWHWL
jgi:hypothetical protein